MRIQQKQIACGGLGLIFFLVLFTLNYQESRTINNNNDNVHAVKNKETKSIRNKDILINKITINNALEFVNTRRREYEENNLMKRWRMRGIGYLYYYHNMVLLAELPEHPTVGRNVVTIRNVHPSANETYDGCFLWEFYVRVNGPEIFAGSATPVPGDKNNPCYWEFPFDLAVPGSYLVDTKALYYNATSYMETPCPVFNNELTNNNSYYHKGFKGFKMYAPAEMCCEICARIAPDCKYWASPPLGLSNPSWTNTGCELYFKDNTSEWIPESRFMNDTLLKEQQERGRRLDVERLHGPSVGKRPIYYVGCGWSFWMSLDFPCLNGDLDDRIYIDNENSTFIFDDNKAASLVTSRQLDDDNLPLCNLTVELPENHKGRWVRGEWPNSTECPHEMEMDSRSDEGFFIVKIDPDRPLCWHRDDLSIVGLDCLEMNCQFITPESQWTTSSIHQEKQWYGLYKNYDCQYKQYTDKQLQQCIHERKIKSITGSGHSIFRYLYQYVKQRTRNLEFYNSTDDDGLEIQLSTLSLLHLRIQQTQEELSKMPTVDPTKSEFYWVNGLYLASEREHEGRGSLQIKKSEVAREVLTPKNYRMLNFYDMTAAFAFDTATQRDGMHIIGPPMKMVITKLFHYMCLNTSVA